MKVKVIKFDTVELAVLAVPEEGREKYFVRKLKRDNLGRYFNYNSKTYRIDK